MALSERLAALCDLFEEELERQENLLALTKAQAAAAAARDVEALQARTRAIELLVVAAAEQEPARLRLVREIVDEYRLDPEQQTLSGLLQVAAEPWQARLAWLQRRLREVVSETQRHVTNNRRRISRMRQRNDALLRQMTGAPASGGYSEQGQNSAMDTGRPRLVNQVG